MLKIIVMVLAVLTTIGWLVVQMRTQSSLASRLTPQGLSLVELAMSTYESRSLVEMKVRQKESRKEYEKLLRNVEKGKAVIISVMDHGARGDGIADDRPALERAIAAAQEVPATDRLKVVVVHLPESFTFLLSPVVLSPTARNLELRIDGTVLTPTMESFPPAPRASRKMTPELQRMQYAFIEVANADKLKISGFGSVEGRGAEWWRIRKREPMRRAPSLLLIRDSKDVAVSHVELRNSPFYHVVILRSKKVRLKRLNVSTPSNSVNTDGIDILASSDVRVKDCWIATGDDNVAVKERSEYVEVVGGTFYKGHGLSIGSLGERGTEASVSHVHLADVTFVKSVQAARIKTWQGGRGHANNITFKNLTVQGVGIPIVIDQFYCPVSQHPADCTNSSKAVAISDVTIDGLSGWHTSGVAAMLHCSEAIPCSVNLANLSLVAVRLASLFPITSSSQAPGCSNIVRCFNVVPGNRPHRTLSVLSPGGGSIIAPCSNGNEMHGFRLDRTRKGKRPPFTCVHPP